MVGVDSKSIAGAVNRVGEKALDGGTLDTPRDAEILGLAW